MHTYMGYSAESEVQEALQEACAKFKEQKPKLIIFFSDGERFTAFSEGLYQRFPQATVIGASTYAAFSPQGFCRHALNVAALMDDLEVSAGVIREISRHPLLYYQDTVLAALQKLPLESLKAADTCCLVLNPAGTACEELVLDTLEMILKGFNFPILGGSASSDVCASGVVSLNGIVYANSSIFTFIHLTSGRLNIQLENIYRPVGPRHVVTKADPVQRTLYELDHEPAAAVLCRQLGVSEEALPQALAEHPFGRLPGDKLYIDEVERVNPDRSITTYCRLLNYSPVSLLELGEFPATMDQTLAAVKKQLGAVDFSLIVNCYSRTKLYQRQGWMETFTEKLGASLGNYLGFTSHGEQLGSFNINLTLLILSFGREQKSGR